jgi:hypothetical protein
MKTVVYCKPEDFCIFCKETGGILPQAPLTFHCMSEPCKQPECNCEYVKHGGTRP